MHRIAQEFGSRLRLQRERQNVGLSGIATQTKIKRSLLEELERGDASHWPSGIFRRAYIRAYAQAIGLDADAVVREFLEIHPDPMESVDAGSLAAARDSAAPTISKPSTRLRFLVDSFVDAFPLSRIRNTEPSSKTPGHRVELPSGPPQAQLLDNQLELHHEQPGEASDPADVTAADVDTAVSEVLQPQEEAIEKESSRLTEKPTAPQETATIPAPDLDAVASWCTAVAQVEDLCATTSLLPEAARILGASGMIVWIWNAATSELRPALSHGYPDAVLAQVQPVGRQANNATGVAFRSGQTCVVKGSERYAGALVAPIMAAVSCIGVLAVELPQGLEQLESTRALVNIFAAQLARVPTLAAPAESMTRHTGRLAAER